MLNATNEKARCVNNGPLEITNQQPKHSAFSIATREQYLRILSLLRTGRRSTIELRKAGVIAPAVRIKELKDKYGYLIPTVARVSLWDDQGFEHPRIAIYELHGEPDGAP